MTLEAEAQRASVDGAGDEAMEPGMRSGGTGDEGDEGTRLKGDMGGDDALVVPPGL